MTGSKYLPPWRLATLSGPGIGHLASGEVPGWEAAGSRTGAEGDPSDGAPGSMLQPGVAVHLALPPRPRLGIKRQALGPHLGAQGEGGKPLTLYSADTPRSVSRSELQGNCPVTLYTFTEKLGDKGTEL